jgi:hypothetical protein
MKKATLLLIIGFSSLFLSSTSFFWGQIGHRTVGHIAEAHLTKKAKKQIQRVLGDQTLAEVSTWMDEVRSDEAYNYANTWHYCTIPDGMTYAEAPKQEGGDVVWAIEKIIESLKSNELSDEEEEIQLKFLVHLVGDIHQPLHVGNGTDRGGNDQKVTWFGSKTNLHSIWDSRMIDSKQLSYTEFSNWVNHASKAQIKEWQAATVRDWAHESMTYRDQLYSLPDQGRLSYRYSYDNFDVVKLRIQQAGIRLAGVINEIYH